MPDQVRHDKTVVLINRFSNPRLKDDGGSVNTLKKSPVPPFGKGEIILLLFIKGEKDGF
jgi:hypothetical protein